MNKGMSNQPTGLLRIPRLSFLCTNVFIFFFSLKEMGDRFGTDVWTGIWALSQCVFMLTLFGSIFSRKKKKERLIYYHHFWGCGGSGLYRSSYYPIWSPWKCREKFPILITQPYTHTVIISHDEIELSKPTVLAGILNKSMFTSGLQAICFQ